MREKIAVSSTDMKRIIQYYEQLYGTKLDNLDEVEKIPGQTSTTNAHSRRN